MTEGLLERKDGLNQDPPEGQISCELVGGYGTFRYARLPHFFLNLLQLARDCFLGDFRRQERERALEMRLAAMGGQLQQLEGACQGQLGTGADVRRFWDRAVGIGFLFRLEGSGLDGSCSIDQGHRFFKKETYGCWSQTIVWLRPPPKERGTQHGTLANGDKDKHQRNPRSLNLSHTHLKLAREAWVCTRIPELDARIDETRALMKEDVAATAMNSFQGAVACVQVCSGVGWPHSTYS